MEKVGRLMFPSALRLMQDSERMYGLEAAVGLEKKVKRKSQRNLQRKKLNSWRSSTPFASKGEAKHDAGDRVSRIALTLDCSNNLSNTSHYDVNDGLVAGYAVWTETVPGLASIWYFILPNVYGETKDGRPFSGLAIQLNHGVAIQWDGQLLRHCTSILQNDGANSPSNMEEETLVQVWNQVYEMFSAAKTKLVDFGRTDVARRSAAEQELHLQELARLLDEPSVGSHSGISMTTTTASVDVHHTKDPVSVLLENDAILDPPIVVLD
jgi:hypothetical protein